MALMTVVLFASLTVALASLAQMEPTIAANHLRSAQARAMADSGIERALWALTHALAPDGFGGTGEAPNVTIAAGAAPPYDGTRFIVLGVRGGFHLTMTGTDPNVRVARAVGWTPTNDPDDPRTKSQAEIVATLARVRNLARELPCALCVASAVTLTASRVDARGTEATDCGPKIAAAATAGLTYDAATLLHGAGAPVAPAGVEGRDWRQNQPLAFVLTAEDLDTLRAIAIQRGTYIRPPSDARIEPAGVTSGVVFVDTPAGTNAVTATNVANVGVGPGFGASLPFRGWLVVNGNVTLMAGADLDALVYAANAVVTDGAADVAGAVVARQALGGAVSLTGLSLRFDCGAARAAGYLPQGWFIRPGTYCDGTAGC